MVIFQTQNPNLGKFWRALELKGNDHMGYSMAIWCIILLFYGTFGNLVAIWYIFSPIWV
jgi:hypothetical protein